MKKYDKLIFVDEDDTSRSVMAKMIMKQKHLLSPLEIESRGLVVLFPEPMNQKAEAVLISKGYSTKDHQSVQLKDEEFQERTIVLAMQDKEKEKIIQNYPSWKNIYTLMEYLHLEGEVLPLYGEPLSEYGKCCETLEKLIDKLVIRLNEEELGL